MSIKYYPFLESTWAKCCLSSSVIITLAKNNTFSKFLQNCSKIPCRKTRRCPMGQRWFLSLDWFVMCDMWYRNWRFIIDINRLRRYRQQPSPLLYRIDIWPARNSRLTQRETNHYLTRCASVLAWSCLAGRSPEHSTASASAIYYILSIASAIKMKIIHLEKTWRQLWSRQGWRMDRQKTRHSLMK